MAEQAILQAVAIPPSPADGPLAPFPTAAILPPPAPAAAPAAPAAGRAAQTLVPPSAAQPAPVRGSGRPQPPSPARTDGASPAQAPPEAGVLPPPAMLASASVRFTAGHPAPTQAPPPFEQLAPVLISLVNDSSGAHRMTLRLRPDALGQVNVLFDQRPGGPLQVRISAERSETLALLQRDTLQLQQALDQAGIPRAGMTLSFHAAPAEQAGPGALDGGNPSALLPGTGQFQQGSSDGRAPRFHAPPAGQRDGISASGTISTTAGPRSGLDITA